MRPADDREFGVAGPTAWRPSIGVSLWLPVIASFVLQVPPSVWLALNENRSVVVGIGIVGIAVVGPVALIFARRAPGPVAAVICLAASADLFVDPQGAGPPYVAVAFALIGAIVRGARVWAFVSVAVMWLAALTTSIVYGQQWQPARVAVLTISILIVLAVGEWIRSRRERESETRAMWERRQQTEVQAERVRIARELHDVLAHSLSQINVQAGVGLHLMDKHPDKAADALASIKETSKTALDEVRSVLGVLRAEDGADPAAPLVPEPDLRRLPGLIASLGEHGIRGDLDDRLGTGTPAPVQLAVYRIVQESLTNVQRHSTATSVRVVLEQTDSDYQIEVFDNGQPVGRASDHGGGRGLLGMRERAELLGGSLDAGHAPTGGFRVSVRIPVRKSQRVS